MKLLCERPGGRPSLFFCLTFSLTVFIIVV
jgi:hypothetical protein